MGRVLGVIGDTLHRSDGYLVIEWPGTSWHGCIRLTQPHHWGNGKRIDQMSYVLPWPSGPYVGFLQNTIGKTKVVCVVRYI